MRILYPLPLNQSTTIATVFRKVATHLDHEVWAYYGDRGQEMDLPIRTIEVPHDIPLRPWSVANKMYRFLRPYLCDFDVIHTPTSTSALFSLIRKLSPERPALVHTFHNAAEVLPATTVRLRAKRYMKAKYFDELTAVSPFVAETIATHYGREPTVIPNGVNLELFHPSRSATRPDRYLFVGRMVDQKHPLFVIRLAEANPNAEFVFCGTGPLEDEVQRADQTHDNVRYLGYTETDRLAELYASSAALIVPFENEGFSLVALESLAAGTPVIGVDGGNIPNLILDGINGVLLDSLDVPRWGNKLEAVTDMHSEDVRASVADYSWDVVANAYQALYESL